MSLVWFHLFIYFQYCRYLYAIWHACQLICAYLACFLLLEAIRSSQPQVSGTTVSTSIPARACCVSLTVWPLASMLEAWRGYPGIENTNQRELGTKHCMAKKHSPCQLPTEACIHWSNALAPKVKAKNRRHKAMVFPEYRERSNGFSRVAIQL